MQQGPLLAKRDTPSLKTSSGYCTVSYGVKDEDGSYCALLCMTNATIFYWESEADLQGGKSPCVTKITAFNEGSDPRTLIPSMIVSFLFSSDMHERGIKNMCMYMTVIVHVWDVITEG